MATLSRKALAEISRSTRELRSVLESYDSKWFELKVHNQTHRHLVELDDGRRDAKRHTSKSTVESIDLKHFYDTRAKIEADLEWLLKKLHRAKPSLVEWGGHHELRGQRDEFQQLKKDVEVRYKRGKAFYKNGSSSDDTENTEAKITDFNQSWIAGFIRELQLQRDAFGGEVEELRRRLEDEPRLRDRHDQLHAFQELHQAHIVHLEGLLRRLRNSTEGLSAAALEVLKDTLTPYVEGNTDLTYVVTEDVYADVCDDVVEEAPPSEPPTKPAGVTKPTVVAKTAARSVAKSAKLTPAKADRKSERRQTGSSPSSVPLKAADAVDPRVAWSTFVKSEVQRPSAFVDIEDDVALEAADQPVAATPASAAVSDVDGRATSTGSGVRPKLEPSAVPSPTKSKAPAVRGAAEIPSRQPTSPATRDVPADDAWSPRLAADYLLSKHDHDQASTAVDSSGTELLEECRSDRALRGQVDVVSVSWAPPPGATSQVAVTAGESVAIYRRVRGWSYGVLAGKRAGWFPEYCASSRDTASLQPMDLPDRSERVWRRVLWDWDASDIGPFVSLRDGDMVEITGQRSGWFRGRRKGTPESAEGWFPDYMLSPPTAVFRSAAWQLLLDASRSDSCDDCSHFSLSWSKLLSGHRPETVSLVEEVVTRAFLRCQNVTTPAEDDFDSNFLERTMHAVEAFEP